MGHRLLPGHGRAAESEDELVDELREVLEDATRIRLRADVPVAAYVSGGLDSSAIAAFARRPYRDELFSFGLTSATRASTSGSTRRESPRRSERR